MPNLPSQKICKQCGESKPISDYFIDRKGYATPYCDICKKAKGRAYHAANRDRLNAVSCKWQRENPEKAREQSRRYYSRNRQVINQRDRLKRQVDPDYNASRCREWRLKNPEQDRDVQSRYRQTHLELVRVADSRRASRRRGAVGTYTAAQWEALKASFDYRCLLCGKGEPEIRLTVDHIVPVSRGGSNNIDNLQPLCRSCNSHKYAKIIDLR